MKTRPPKVAKALIIGSRDAVVGEALLVIVRLRGQAHAELLQVIGDLGILEQHMLDRASRS